MTRKNNKKKTDTSKSDTVVSESGGITLENQSHGMESTSSIFTTSVMETSSLSVETLTKDTIPPQVSAYESVFLSEDALLAELPPSQPSTYYEEKEEKSSFLQVPTSSSSSSITAAIHTVQWINEQENLLPISNTTTSATIVTNEVTREESNYSDVISIATSAEDDGTWRTVPELSKEESTEEYFDQLATLALQEDLSDILSRGVSPEHFHTGDMKTPVRSTISAVPLFSKIVGCGSSADGSNVKSTDEVEKLPRLEPSLLSPSSSSSPRNDGTPSTSENLLEFVMRYSGTLKPSWIDPILQHKVVAGIIYKITPYVHPMSDLAQYLFTIWLQIALWFLDTLLLRVLPVMERLFNLWLWMVLLPCTVSKWTIQRSWRIFLLLAVYILNRAPSGHKILKALNGHVMKH